MRDAHGHATWAPRIGLYWEAHLVGAGNESVDTATRNEGGSETSGDIRQTSLVDDPRVGQILSSFDSSFAH